MNTAAVAVGMWLCNRLNLPPVDTGSICAMKRNTHVFIPEQQFKLLSGADNLGYYQVRCMYACRIWLAAVASSRSVSQRQCS